MKKLVTKADGQKTVFNPQKIESTCIRAGATRRIAKKIARQVYHKIQNGSTTKEIYRIVLDLLSKNEGVATKHRYRLKESIMQMGPAGFSFETYVAQLLDNFGYKIKSIRTKVRGKCVKHEIDLILISESNKRCMVECKYHNLAGRYTGLKDSLYTHARFLDLSDSFDLELLVCNTKVSSDVKSYARCVGQSVLSWRYPEGKSLEKMIELKKLYPITILNPTKKELELFVRNNIMMAKDMLNMTSEELASLTKISLKRIVNLQNLARGVIS